MVPIGVFQVLVSGVFVILSIRADCNNPPIIANSKNNITGYPPYPEGTVVRFDCNSGYNTVGTSRYFTCNGTEWKGGPFQCEMIYCSRIEPPENGRITNQPTNEVGTAIQFACSEGYDISSTDSMLCQADGNWSPASPPTCSAKDCGEFGSIQYASVFQDNSNAERNHFGSVVEVTCLDGRVLNGPPRVECEANGQWGQRPTCELLQCPPYPNAHASCISNSLLHGSFYIILCRGQISTRTGPDAAECVKGAWDSLEMACYCDCKIPDSNSSFISLSNLNEFGNLAHNTKLLWTCVNGSSVSPLNYSVICTDGELRVMKNEEEILSTNKTTMYDIYHTIMSEVCILPTTISTTTTATTTLSTTTTTTTTPSSATTKAFVTAATTMTSSFVTKEAFEKNVSNRPSPTTMTSSFVTKEAFEKNVSNRPLPTEAEFVTTVTTVKMESAANMYISDIRKHILVFFALIMLRY